MPRIIVAPSQMITSAGAVIVGLTVSVTINLRRVALRKLLTIDNAARLEDLWVLPGNHLEALKGDRKGQHSIRINDQFRVCFVWRNGNAYDVEITDYH